MTLTAEVSTGETPNVNRRQRVLQVAAAIGPLLVLGVGAWTHRSIADDGYIYLRIVRNVIAGHGPVFNVGERVETYTGPLWLAFLSLTGAVHPPALPWISVLAGIAFTIIAVALAMFSSSRLMRQVSSGLLLPFGAVVFVSLGVVWTFASTGLETGLTFLWLSLCLWVLVRWAATGQVSWWEAVLLGLGPLVRPELALSSLIFLAPVLVSAWRRAGLGETLRVVGWAGIAPVVYQLFRMAYFGQVVATTAITKEGTMPRPGWGWLYLKNFIGVYWLVIPLILTVIVYALLVTALHNRRYRTVLLALPVSGMVNGGFVVLMGGDYMHGRLLLPALFATIAPISMLPLTRRYLVGLLVLPWALAAITALRVTPGLTVPVVGIVGDARVTPEDMGWSQSVPPYWWQGAGFYVRDGFGNVYQKTDIPMASRYPPTVTSPGGIGLSSYVVPLDYYVYDEMGLANPLSAHMELTRRGLPGHEKLLPVPWMAAQLSPPGTPTDVFETSAFKPDPSLFGELIPDTSGAELAAQTEFARKALRCEPLARLVNQPWQPLTLRTMAENFASSFSMSRLRVPPDPAGAYRKFCGRAGASSRH